MTRRNLLTRGNTTMQETSTPRVLIVDDEEDLCQYLKLMISKKASYDVDTATDGEMAFEKIKNDRFNLVISDINMPKMDGIELLTNIKNYDPDIEVIMLTGKSSLETAVQALQIKAFDYIEKPVESRKLLVAMGNALGKQRLNFELKSVLERVSKERQELKAQVEQQSADLARKERLALTGAVAATLTGELLRPVEQFAKGLTSILESKDDAARVEQLVAELRPGAERMQEVLNEIVTFSEQVRPEITPVDVSTFFKDLTEYHAGLHPEVEFELSGLSEGVTVSADSGLLARAFGSIIENSCDAMNNTGKLTIQVGKDDGSLKVVFRDSGTGFPADKLDKVFLPFFTTKSGSGLGMTITKRIIEDHAGEIQAENAEGGGARLTVRIPLKSG